METSVFGEHAHVLAAVRFAHVGCADPVCGGECASNDGGAAMSARSIRAAVSGPRPIGLRSTSAGGLAVVGIALGVAILVGGCSSSSNKGTAATTTTTATAGATSTTAAASSNGGGSTGNGQSSSGDTAPPSPPSGPAPAIATFVTPDNIDCHNGNLQNFSASWTTTNAVKTTISIDGPGVYKTYPANGSDSLPFNCSSSHTFLLTAYGQDGRTATKTITLQPRNVQTTTTTPTTNPTTTT